MSAFAAARSDKAAMRTLANYFGHIITRNRQLIWLGTERQQPSRLLQQPAVRCQRRAAAEVTGHSERGHTSGDGSKEVRPHHPGASRTSLAARPPTH